MAFTSLTKRLSQLPLMLAGPILRQVTTDQVTVWVALQKSATVTLTVYGPDQSTLVAGATPVSSSTYAIGQNLHIVAVTLRSPAAFTENTLYFYDLSFSVAGTTLNLSQAVTFPTKPLVPNPFAYSTYKYPSFALPPKDITKLRLIHGSCRKPHGEGFDALAILDGLIAEKVTDPLARPHQLILSGDQVYTDDVADTLLLMLTDAGDTLLGWTETMTIGVIPLPTAKFPPYVREAPLKAAGFTSDDLRSQLMSLGEYLAMYMFAWSEVLWPDPKTLDTFEEMVGISFPGVDPTGQGTFEVQGDAYIDLISPVARDMLNRKAIIEFDTRNVQTYYSTLTKVRKALANVPSYMICDDHEVTDDWNMTRRFCQDVYGGLLGQRVIQNALVAYAVCQAWGNVPEQFATHTPSPAGLTLLQKLQDLSALPASQAPASYTSNASLFMKIVGVHTDAELQAQAKTPPSDYRVYHEAGAQFLINKVSVNDTSLRYNFSIEGPGHQVIVTDSRTWRSFPVPGLDTHPDLIPAIELNSQFELDVPALGNRQLLVVFTTNFPPIAGIRRVETIGKTAVNANDYLKSAVYEHDLYDSWEFPTGIYDSLIARLSKKLSSAGQPNAPVVLLSGDVHHGFSSRLAYWADNAQFGDLPGPQTNLTLGALPIATLAKQAGVGDTQITLASALNLSPPAFVLIDTEILAVTSIDATKMILTVTRGAKSSTAAIHQTGAQFFLLTAKRVFAQLVCSALKNEIADTRGLQDVGYTYAPNWLEGLAVPEHVPEFFLGWNVTASQRVSTHTGVINVLFATPDDPSIKVVDATHADDTSSSGTILVTPDYRYRLDYLTTTASGQTTSKPVELPPFVPGNLIQAMKTQALASRAYTNLLQSGGKLPDVVGRNNLGEVGFSWDANKGMADSIFHTLRWQQTDPTATEAAPKPPLVLAAAYEVSTDIDDPNYQIPAKVMPA